jgi:hypothetical protein
MQIFAFLVISKIDLSAHAPNLLPVKGFQIFRKGSWRVAPPIRKQYDEAYLFWAVSFVFIAQTLVHRLPIMQFQSSLVIFFISFFQFPLLPVRHRYFRVAGGNGLLNLSGRFHSPGGQLTYRAYKSMFSNTYFNPSKGDGPLFFLRFHGTVALWAVHLFHGTSLEELSSILISLIFPEHNRNLKEFILKDISSGEFNHKLPDHVFFRFDWHG